jgi:hypothetical protein
MLWPIKAQITYKVLKIKIRKIIPQFLRDGFRD